MSCAAVGGDPRATARGGGGWWGTPGSTGCGREADLDSVLNSRGEHVRDETEKEIGRASCRERV